MSNKIYLTIDKCGKRQIVEQVCEILPHIRIPILSQTLVVKTIHLKNKVLQSDYIKKRGRKERQRESKRQRERERDKETERREEREQLTWVICLDS